MDPNHVKYRMAANYLRDRLIAAKMPTPMVGIICGSGLSELSDAMEGSTLTVKYSEIPGFPAKCGVAGHKGELVFGRLSGVDSCCFRGRFHSYEGYDMKTVVLPVYVLRCLDVKICIVTNAAGGLNPAYKVGDVVAVSDHLAIPMLAGNNPLVGHGTYCFVSGPQYESKAECRFLRRLGGDAVGMSTVPEIVAAHHCDVSASIMLCVLLMDEQPAPVLI
jgi:purine-nucleoside phosphorylase